MSKALSFAVELFLPDLGFQQQLHSLQPLIKGIPEVRLWPILIFSLRHLAHPYPNFYSGKMGNLTSIFNLTCV